MWARVCHLSPWTGGHVVPAGFDHRAARARWPAARGAEGARPDGGSGAGRSQGRGPGQAGEPTSDPIPSRDVRPLVDIIYSIRASTWRRKGAGGCSAPDPGFPSRCTLSASSTLPPCGGVVDRQLCGSGPAWERWGPPSPTVAPRRAFLLGRPDPLTTDRAAQEFLVRVHRGGAMGAQRPPLRGSYFGAGFVRRLQHRGRS